MAIDGWRDALGSVGLPRLENQAHLYVQAGQKEAGEKLKTLQLPSVRLENDRAIDCFRRTITDMRIGGIIVTKDPANCRLAQYLAWPCVEASACLDESPGSKGGRIALLDIGAASAWHPTQLVMLATQLAERRCTPVVVFCGSGETEEDRMATRSLREATLEVSPETSSPIRHCRQYSFSLTTGTQGRVLEEPEKRFWRELLARRVADQVSVRRPCCVSVAGEYDAERLYAAIRGELAAQGELTGPEHSLMVLRPWDEREKDQITGLKAGLIIEFTQKVRGHQRGARVKIKEVLAGGSELIVTDAGGYNSTLILTATRHYKVYDESPLAIRVGEYVRTTVKRGIGATKRLNPNRPYRVDRVTSGHLLLKGGAKIPRDYGHLEYAYVAPEDRLESLRYRGGILVVVADDRYESLVSLPTTLSAAGARKPVVVLTANAMLLSYYADIPIKRIKHVSLADVMAEAAARRSLDLATPDESLSPSDAPVLPSYGDPLPKVHRTPPAPEFDDPMIITIT